MKKPSLILLTLCALLVLALLQGCSAKTGACGANCVDGGARDAGVFVDAGPNPLGTVCADFNSAVCAFLTRCGSVASTAACKD